MKRPPARRFASFSLAVAALLTAPLAVHAQYFVTVAAQPADKAGASAKPSEALTSARAIYSLPGWLRQPFFTTESGLQFLRRYEAIESGLDDREITPSAITLASVEPAPSVTLADDWQPVIEDYQPISDETTASAAPITPAVTVSIPAFVFSSGARADIRLADNVPAVRPTEVSSSGISQTEAIALSASAPATRSAVRHAALDRTLGSSQPQAVGSDLNVNSNITISTTDAYDHVYIGVTANGILNQTGGNLTVTTGAAPSEVDVGYTNGRTGTYNLSVGGLNTFDLNVGFSGTGAFVQTGGGVTVSDRLAIGSDGGTTCTYAISGAGALIAQFLVLGDLSTGTFTQGGTSVVTTASTIFSSFQFGGQSGDTYNLNGGTLVVPGVSDGSNTLNTGIFNFNGGTLRASASDSPTGATPTTFFKNIGTANVLASGAIIDTNGFSVTIAQPLLHSSGATDGGLTKVTGGGTLTLAGANTYLGPTVVIAGVLKAGVGSVAGTSGAFGNNSAVTLVVAAGVSLDITGFNTQIGSLAGGNGTNGSVTLGAATLTTGGNNTNTSYSGVISGTGGLTKIGAGTQTLAGANTYTGATAVNAGTLQAGVASVAGTSGAFGNNSAVTLANTAGVVLDLNGFDTQIGSLAGGGGTGGNVTLGNATLTTGANNTSTSYAGAISGAGGLVKAGTGTQTLTAASSYAGTTTVSGGTLQIDNNPAATTPTAGRLAGTTGITINNGGTLSLSGSLAVTDRLNNASPMTLNGGGKFATGGVNEGTAPAAAGIGGAVGLGALTLASTSAGSRAVIDFGSTQTGSALVFSSLAASGKLAFVNILNFTGGARADNGLATNDRLLFTTDPGFTVADLANWQFSNDAGTLFASGAIEISYNTYFEIVPAPEPATWLAGTMTVLLGASAWRRRQRPAGVRSPS